MLANLCWETIIICKAWKIHLLLHSIALGEITLGEITQGKRLGHIYSIFYYFIVKSETVELQTLNTSSPSAGALYFQFTIQAELSKTAQDINNFFHMGKIAK